MNHHRNTVSVEFCSIGMTTEVAYAKHVIGVGL